MNIPHSNILKVSAATCAAASGFLVLDVAVQSFGWQGYPLTLAGAIATYYGWEFGLATHTSQPAGRIIGGAIACALAAGISVVAGKAINQGEINQQQATLDSEYTTVTIPAWKAAKQEARNFREAADKLLSEERDQIKEALKETKATLTLTNGRKQEDLLKTLTEDQERMQTRLAEINTELRQPVALPEKPEKHTATVTAVTSIQSYAFEALVPVLLFFAALGTTDKKHRETDKAEKLQATIQQAESAMLETIYQASTNLQNTIADAKAVTLTANKAIAACNRPAMGNAMDETKAAENILDENQALELIKQEKMPTDSEGNISVEVIMGNTGLGRTRAKRVQQTAIDNGYVDGIQRGKGMTARYKDPELFTAGNVFSLPQLRSA